MQTEQEKFWAGSFGDEYSKRNTGVHHIAGSTAAFAKILARTSGIGSIIELGANIGINMHALRALLPTVKLRALELNASAYRVLSQIPGVEAHHGSLFDFRPPEKADLAFCRGVLIHTDPAFLPYAYDALCAASRKYVLIGEYYNPTPVEVNYRGHEGQLFKRDFCAEMMARHPLRLVDYGFVYQHDPVFPLGDMTWFLMEHVTPPGS